MMLCYAMNMPNKIIDRNFKALSVKQQIGLYVVLTKFHTEENSPFFSSDFSAAMKSFLLIEDPGEYKRVIGGILGALSKNNILEKISSDKDPLWRLPEDIYANRESCKKELQHIPQVVARWEK